MVGCDVRRFFGLKSRGLCSSSSLTSHRAIPLSHLHAEGVSGLADPCVVGAEPEECLDQDRS